MFSRLFSDAARLAAIRALVERVAPILNVGCCVRLWDGSLVPLGASADGSRYVAIHSPGVISSLLRQPTLDNLVRHYAAGRIELAGADLIEFGELVRSRRARVRLPDLGLGWLARQALPFLFYPADQATVVHADERDGRRTAASDDQALIRFHYDVGNEFYQLFLDPEMQYSCGYFTDWENSLEQAQLDKMEMICRKLRLEPGDKLLDVGCGWGGLICHAARHYGVWALGITLSEEQLKFARQKILRLGLQDRVAVELCDYRQLTGTFDKIASIGMYEHVGIANYPAYFGKLCSLLRDKGVLLNHGITRGAKPSHAKFQKGRPEHRLLQKYIFPGGEIDHIGHTLQSMEACRFMIHDVEGWREHYARTTRLWCERLSARAAEAIRLVGSERYRLWVAYLAGVSFAFLDGSARIYQVVATKHAAKGLSGLPATRADLYRAAASPAVRRAA